MKKLLLLATFTSIYLTGCNIIQPTSQSFPDIKLENIAVIGKQKAPKGVKDGKFSGTASNGRILKTIVKNGYLDQYVDIYHPNGALHSHTPLVNGIPEGWSYGYTPENILRTKVLYQQGKTIKIQMLNSEGNIIKEF